jgi:hypothetical protein
MHVPVTFDTLWTLNDSSDSDDGRLGQKIVFARQRRVVRVYERVAPSAFAETVLQARGFMPVEGRIITIEKLAFESICFKQDIPGNSLPLQFQEFPQAIDCARYALVNHRVISGDFDVSAHALHKRLELLAGVFPFIRQSEVKGRSQISNPLRSFIFLGFRHGDVLLIFH